MNIAIYTKDFNWAGGVDLLHGIVKGLLAQTESKHNVYILVHDPNIKEEFKIRYKKKIILTLKKILKLQFTFKSLYIKDNKTEENDIDEYVIEIFSNEDVSIIFYNQNNYKSVEKILKEIKADIVLPILNNYFNNNSSFPWIGYMFDFVYKYFPELYTSEFCLGVDINYARTLLNAKSVIVNSIEVARDIKKFFPYNTTKIFSMPFAPYSNIQLFKSSLENKKVKEKFGINNRYFMICNQFWLHKSHETAFEALSILHKLRNNNDINLVCTGKMTDLSNSSTRKDQLSKYIADLNLENEIHFLGHISKLDQLSLMIRSEGVIQPTKFEGGPGGGSVYMSVAYGIPAIVSDINVNKEIKGERLVTFFKVGDAFELAEKMKKQLELGYSLLSPSEIEKKNNEKLFLLGETLNEAISYTLNN